jgi:hypothetical protein
MLNHLGPIEVVCDAPPYVIVQGCRAIGLLSPEDVRWCRVVHVPPPCPGWKEVLLTWPWQALWGARRSKNPRCSCGQELPPFRCHAFWLSTGSLPSYFISQCARCRTVFWDEA